MSQQISASQLFKNLAQECEQAMALVDVLLEEQSCLIKLDTLKLGELAIRKEAMMLDLEKRFLSNMELAKTHGFPANMDGLEALASALAAREPRLNGTFFTLKDTLSQAQRLNNANGELVTEQLMGLQKRIAILTAAALVEQSESAAGATYGPKGGMSGASSASTSMPRAVIR